MKKTTFILLAIAISAATSAQAELNINVNLGGPTPPPPRVIVSAPPAVFFETPPLFVAPSRLGFYVGVDTPYDIIFSSDYYYVYLSNNWLRARSYNGPWVEVPYLQLPPEIRRHRIEKIRSYRDKEYRIYRDDREHYRGRSFRPEHLRKEEIKNERKHDREEIKDERRRDREEWKEEKQERKHEKHGRD